MGGGILIEADKAVFQKLLINRPNPKIAKYNVALCDKDEMIEFMQISGPAQMLSGIVSEYDPRHLERIKRECRENGGEMNIITMQGARFDTIMANHSDIDEISYLSIDVEGGEMQILQSIDFEKFDIKLIGIENNYGDFAITRFLQKRGYKLIFALGCDDFYAKKDK